MIARIDDQSWAINEVLIGLEARYDKMTQTEVTQSSMAEKSVWVYAVHMVATFGNIEITWCMRIIEKTVLWLESNMYVHPFYL